MKRNLLLAALVVTGFAAQAQVPDQPSLSDQVVPMDSEAKIVSMCLSAVDSDKRLKAQKSAGGKISDADLASLSEMADLCNTQLRQIYGDIRELNSEYIVMGFGLFAGLELNTLKITKASGNLSGIIGGTGFLAYNNGVVSPRLVPLIGGTLGASYVTSSPQLIEFQSGLIIFVAKGSKTINDFNGTYIGGGAETRTPGFSELNAKSSLALGVYSNGKAIAIVGMKSSNTGTGAGLGIKAMGIDMETMTGAGMSLWDIPKFYGNQISKGFNNVISSLTSLVD